jgi:hypothetical protein
LAAKLISLAANSILAMSDMAMNRRRFVQSTTAAATVAAAASGATAASSDVLTVDGVATAWLAALPLIEVAAARARETDPKAPVRLAGLNSFVHARRLVIPRIHAITTPNNDTFYSQAFVDLTRGPVQLTVPDVGARYQSVAIMDMFTNNNAVLGRRTPGGAAGTWTLVGAGMPAPQGARVVRVATPHAWLLVRTLVDGPDDIDAAHKAQDGLVLDGPPAGSFPPTATRGAPWPDYFRSVDALLAAGPAPTPTGLAGFFALKARAPTFDPAALGPDAAIVEAGVKKANAVLNAASANSQFTQGWQYPRPDLGDFGDDIGYRAIVAIAAIAALVPAEAMYLRAQGDDGVLFHGDGLYRLSLPTALPVDGFWSLTMYEATADGQFFFTENPIDRYSIGDRTGGVRKSPTGGVDIWISRTDPGGDRTANWLPAPQARPFALILRAYLPRPELLEGRYRLPAITPA